MDATDHDDHARREEARLAKTMARRGAASAVSSGKPTAAAKASGSTTAAANGDSKSRAGAALPRSQTYSPSSTTPVTPAPSASLSPSVSFVDNNTDDSIAKSHSGASGSSGMQKSPSFGSSRNIVTRTTSSGPPTTHAVVKKTAPVDEEAIRKREAEFEAERQRLLKVEQDLIRNGKNALGDMDEINRLADKQEKERLERVMREEEAEKKKIAAQPKQPAAAPQPAAKNAAAPQPATSSPRPKPQDPAITNKALIDDVDALLAQLNQAASSSYGQSSSALSAASSGSQSGPQQNPQLEKAKATLRTRKASVPSYVSNALGASATPTLDNDLAQYIRDIVAAMKPVQEITSQVPLTEDSLSYDTFSSSLDAMLLAIITDVHLLIDHHSRELISNYAMELIDKAIVLMEDVHEQSYYISKGTSAPGQHQSATPGDIILSSQNKFILFLKHLAQTITSAAQKQAEDIQAKKDSQTALSVCVQETALHAQQLANILKEPLFEPQAFKDRLSSLVATIKKASVLIPVGASHDAVMDCTRKVLEASLKLQESHQQNTGENAPHMLVFQAMGDLLRALLATIQN